MAANVGYGSDLATTTGAIAQVRSITPGEASGTAVDITTLDSSDQYRDFAGGLVDPGEMTFDIVYDPTNATHKVLGQLLGSRATRTWKIAYSGSTTRTDDFTGFVNGLGPEIPLDDVITASVTVKKSGHPGFST